MNAKDISKKLSKRVGQLSFSSPITHTYNPLEYAWEPHAQYLEKFGTGKKEVVLVGMNPGPFGMAQTGVPFGDVTMVKDWMKITGKVDQPKRVHPKRPIQGFDCPRGEVSGSRLWGWAGERFPSPSAFFKRFFVWNYCPLCFMEESGKNRTPDKLPATEKEQLFLACDEALRGIAATLKPKFLIGVGKFAEAQIKQALEGNTGSIKIGTILHPSPASPAANRGWSDQAEKQFAALGVDIR
ncbi:MAG: hypothetical protein KDD66_05470 [Bdellovibrionales bacterium]|nr:hypothetical protein [Bdellovibrionales bacterium]